jgi:hypothetical protein
MKDPEDRPWRERTRHAAFRLSFLYVLHDCSCVIIAQLDIQAHNAFPMANIGNNRYRRSKYNNGLTIIIPSRIICQPGFQCRQRGCPERYGIANQVKKLDFYLIAW